MTDFSSLENLINSPWFWLIILWSLVWKGLALWKAAQNRDLVWFIVMLVLNTLGIVEIIYIFLFANPRFSKKA